MSRERTSAVAVAATACTVAALAALAALASASLAGCGDGGARPSGAGFGSGAATWTPGVSRAGALAGLVRDATTGDPLPDARIRASRDVDPSAEVFDWSMPESEARTSADGTYTLTLLAGNYRVSVEHGDRRVELTYVLVDGGRTRGLDVVIDARPLAVLDVRQLGQSPPLRFRNARPSYRGTIEGTVTDLANGERVSGAVVVSTSPEIAQTLHTLSDDTGRFALDELRPGTYTLSVYYRVVGRGNIEVRRSNILVAAAETTLVELVLDSRAPQF